MDKGKYMSGLKRSRIGLGMVVGILSTVIGTGILAALINGEILGQASIKTGAGAVLFVSAGLASATAAGKRDKKLLAAVIAGGAYWLCLLCVNALLFSCEYDGVLSSAMLVFGAAACVGILSPGRKNQGKYRHKKY